MFGTFTQERIDVSGTTFHVGHGGSGPPVLLLHGHPRTHATWWQVAPLLANSMTVVCPDLPGFGQSTVPRDTPDHRLSSKRIKAQLCVELMQALGHDQFNVVGHDRGGYVAFRMAMDYPEVIRRLVVLDIVPIAEALGRCRAEFATRWWHWFFYGQPDKPEQAILADPDAWYGGSPEQMGRHAYADFQRAIHNPEVVHGMVEDYRAGLTIDRLHDEQDRKAGRQVIAPTLCLWAQHDDLPGFYGDVLEVWRPWLTTVEGFGLPCGHHMPEEIPVELAQHLEVFLGSAPI